VTITYFDHPVWSQRFTLFGLPIFQFEYTWWRLFQKLIVLTKLYFYVFIMVLWSTSNSTETIQNQWWEMFLLFLSWLCFYLNRGSFTNKHILQEVQYIFEIFCKLLSSRGHKSLFSTIHNAYSIGLAHKSTKCCYLFLLPFTFLF
jgi:hypothetical protein